MQKTILLILIIGVLFIPNTNLFAQDSSNVACISRCELEGACDVTVRGDYAYVTASESGLHIIDISNLEDPVEVGRIGTPGNILDIALSGVFAFAVMGENGWGIIDISVPEELEEVGFFESEGFLSGIEVVGDYLYLVDHSGSLCIMDISNPENPGEVNTLELDEEPNIIRIRDNYAYVCGYKLSIFDISNPDEVGMVGFCRLSYEITDMEINDDYAYVAEWNVEFQGGKFTIIDVSNPENPTEVGSYTHGWLDLACYGIGISSDVACLAAHPRLHTPGLLTLDVSDAANPILVGFYNTIEECKGVDAVGNLAYVTDQNSFSIYYFLQIPSIDVSQEILEFGVLRPDSTRELILNVLNSGENDITITDITIAGDTYSSNFEDEVQLEPDENFDLILTFSPDAEDEYTSELIITTDEQDVFERRVNLHGYGFERVYVPTPGLAWDIDVENGFAYITDYTNGLSIIDIHNPEDPVPTGGIDTPGNARGIFVSGDFAYMANDSAGLYIMDVSDPENPDSVSCIYTPGRALDVFQSGDYVYIADAWRGLHVYDITEPEDPDSVGSFNVRTSADEVIVEGDYAFVAGNSGGLRIIDISQPDSMAEVGFFDPDEHWSNSISVSGNIVYELDRGRVLRVIDMSEFENPEEIRFLILPGPLGYARKVFVWEDFLFIARSGGLQKLDVSDPADPIIVQTIRVPGNVMSVDVENEYAYVTNTELGMFIIDLSEADGIAEKTNQLIPSGYYLSPAYPNPFNSTTRITYGLRITSNVSLKLYDLSGRLIQTLVEGQRQAGIQTTILNAAELPSGLYFVRLSVSGHVFTRKVMLVR